MEQSSQRIFVCQGQNDILIVVIGTEEHPSLVCVAGFGVGQTIFWISSPF